MATSRMEQIDALIKKEVAIALHSHFPDDFISVTQLHVTKDLSYAKVWISSPIDTIRAVKESNNIRKEIRTELSKKITARRVPSLHFVADFTSEQASKIERLITQIKDEER
ncbi:MAG: 30S ribosome-binding factor RbfA [bacterium]